MKSRQDVIKHIQSEKERLEEAKKIQSYLESSDCPKVRIQGIKRIIKHLEQQYQIEKLALALADLNVSDSVRPEDEKENAFTL
ncbi:hypothetical protein [Bacillus sp. NPDC057893]|uniref:hypothetical protein n=1 Tax=Bacillus sp. NPDC057893 TaxID=3346273 RepID=UPI00367064E3